MKFVCFKKYILPTKFWFLLRTKHLEKHGTSAKRKATGDKGTRVRTNYHMAIPQFKMVVYFEKKNTHQPNVYFYWNSDVEMEWLRGMLQYMQRLGTGVRSITNGDASTSGFLSVWRIFIFTDNLTLHRSEVVAWIATSFAGTLAYRNWEQVQRIKQMGIRQQVDSSMQAGYLFWKILLSTCLYFYWNCYAT